MTKTIGRLLGASVLCALCAAASFYAGSLYAPAEAPHPENALSAQFAGDPGDGWMLLGGFLMLIALAITGAGAMLWAQERKN